MPCRSDYMDPTPSEHQATNAVNTAAKGLADRLTYSADVLREFFLSGKKTGVPLDHVNLAYSNEWDHLRKRAGKLYYMVPADAGLLAHVEDLLAQYIEANQALVDNVSGPARASIRAKLKRQQIAHRKADLARLMRTFADKGDTVRLRKVLDADPNKPLDDQLGFSADAF